MSDILGQFLSRCDRTLPKPGLSRHSTSHSPSHYLMGKGKGHQVPMLRLSPATITGAHVEAKTSSRGYSPTVFARYHTLSGPPRQAAPLANLASNCKLRSVPACPKAIHMRHGAGLMPLRTGSCGELLKAGSHVTRCRLQEAADRHDLA